MDNYPPGTWGGDPRAPWNEPEPPECPNCGAHVEWEWKFCPWCSTELDWDEREPNEDDFGWGCA